MGDPEKVEKPKPSAVIQAPSPVPPFDFVAAMKSPPGGNALTALGDVPMPATLQGSPVPWALPPPWLSSQAPAPAIGTFVLDPALANQSTPDGLTTHVLVQPALSLGAAEPARYVVIERPVRAAMRLDVYAVRLEDVYDNPMEAFATRPMISLRSSPLPTIYQGGTYWTSAGQITALGVSGDAVFTATANRDTGAAGSVIVLQTDADFVLIDAGMQTPDATLASAVGDELARLVSAHLGPAPVGEAILSPRPPSGHVTTYIARQTQILTVRATLDQYQDGSVGAVLAVQRQYQDWYLSALRQRLIDERASWEASQPIAPNDSIREQRWQQHLEGTVASALKHYQPPALAVAEDVGGFLQPKDEAPPLQAPTITRDTTGAVDLSSLDWEPADDEYVILVGDKKLGLFPAKGMLWRPATAKPPEPPRAPEPRVVPELRAPGPHGPPPPVPRAVTPWLYMSALGKEGQLLVRIAPGYGVMVDAGGLPRVAAFAGIAAGQFALGAEVKKFLISHPHTDHVRHLIDLIRELKIDAKDLVVSRAWDRIGLIKILKTTTDQDLLDLHYGEKWEPFHPGESKDPVAKLTISVRDKTIDVYALPEAHKDLETEIEAREKDPKMRGKKVPSPMFDNASLVYVMPNESSPSRTAVIGDLRGDRILAMQAGLGAEGFKAAFKDVTVVYGAGHHLSHAAGRTAEDVRGFDALIEATLHQNGELLLLVQTTEAHLGGPPSMTGEAGALVRYFVRQGVRVALTTKAGDMSSAVLVNSNREVTTQGPNAYDFVTDPRVSELWERLTRLREAQRAVRESPEFGPLALDMKGTAAEIEAALQREIDALLQTANDHRALAAKELLEARAGKGDKKMSKSRQEREKQKQLKEYSDAQAERPPKLTTEADILDAATVKGPVEQGFSEEVVARLNAAIASGKPITLAFEFANVPTGVYEAIEKLTDAEQKKALGEKYRLLQELTGKLDENKVPDADRFDILQRVKDLRAEILKALEKLGEEAALKAELKRLDAAIAKLEAQTETVADRAGRDVQGRLTRTRYIKIRDLGLKAFGRGMGALMVIHSIQEASATLQGAGQGQANLPQLALGLTHSVAGVQMGVKMLRGLEVGAKEFGFMAVLEVGMAAAGNYDTKAERAEAVTHAAIRSAANLGCMALGQGIMEASVALPPPFDLIGIGIGVAIMFAGDWVLELFGFKEHQEKPPDAVLDVGKKIDGVLNEYKAMLGSELLAKRPADELTALGAQYPNSLIMRAQYTADERARLVAGKELELTTQFEQGYRAAKGSWFGMQYLDQKAAEFTKLRGIAFQGREDPNRAALEARWRAMDTNVTLTSQDDTWKLDQWNELDRKLTKIGDLIKEGGSTVDRKKLAEAVAAADQMLENARYRLDPTRGGEFRVTPVIDERAGATMLHLYRVKLKYFEERLAGFRRELVRLGGANDALPFDNAVSPRLAYERLHQIRTMYEARVGQVSAVLPELANQTIWEDPAKLTHTLEAAHIQHREELAQLQLLDATLLSASHQATSSLMQFPDDADATLSKLIKEEAKATEKAIENRQYKYGLVFDGELDAILADRGADEDKILATQIDVAFTKRPAGAAGALPPHPFSDLELAALQSGSFDSRDAKLTSTEAQLAYVRDTMAKLKGKLMFQNRFVDRYFHKLKSPFRQWDDDAWFKNVDHHSYATGMTPIVLQQVEHWALGSLVYGVFVDVAPVNTDAVLVLGKKNVKVNKEDIEPLSQAEIVDIARKKSDK